MLGLFSKKKHEPFVTFEDGVRQRKELVNAWRQKYIETFSPYGHFQGMMFHVDETLPPATIKRILVALKEFKRVSDIFAQQVMEAHDTSQRDIKESNRKAIAVRRQLLATMPEASKWPVGIRKWYRLDENIDESQYL